MPSRPAASGQRHDGEVDCGVLLELHLAGGQRCLGGVELGVLLGPEVSAAVWVVEPPREDGEGVLVQDHAEFAIVVGKRER